MPHADILKIVLRFENVAPGQSATQDHRIKIKGVGQLPEHIHYDNGAFSGPGGIVADNTSVTVTNNSAAEASVDVLVEHWHSIPRVFGDVNQDSLAVRPYISGPGGGGLGDDELVKVSDDDTTSGKLDTKLTPGANISLAIGNPGGNETVIIAANVPGTDAPVTVTGDTNADGGSAEHADRLHRHRLEMAAQDEGVAAGQRPTFNFIGPNVGAVDNPAQDRVDIAITGDIGDGAVVERDLWKGDTFSTSSTVFVDGMSGGVVTVPINGDYWAIFEGEGCNMSAAAQVEIGISVNSVAVVVATSERASNGNASDLRPVVTTVPLPGLVAGDVVRMLIRESSGGPPPRIVNVIRRRLSIFKVQ